VVIMTHERGSRDTGWVDRDVWGLRLLGRRAFRVALAVALLLHVPLLPTYLGAWLRLLVQPEEALSILPRETRIIVPVELDADLVADRPAAPAAPPPAMPPAPEEPAAPVSDAPPLSAFDEPMDAGVPDASPPEARDAGGAEDGGAGGAGGAGGGLMDAGVAGQGGAEPVATDAGPADAGAADAGGLEPVRDPFAVAGGPGQVVTEHPNVRIFIAADVVRGHKSLARLFSDMLVKIPQWRELLGDTGLDPIRDFDHILMSGPQMRDARLIEVTADYRMPHARVRAAIERVMRRSDPPGEWLSHPDLMVGTLGDKGHRRVVLLPEKRMIVVLPAQAQDQIPRLKERRPFDRQREVAIALKILTPWRVFIGTKYALTKSLAWLRLQLRPGKGSEHEVVMDLEDESEEVAHKTAEKLRADLELLRAVPLSAEQAGAAGLGLIFKGIGERSRNFGDPVFAVSGKLIRIRTSITDAQLRRIIEFALHKFDALEEKRKQRAAAPGAGPAGSTRPAAGDAP
jgi:hypothetical protein